MVLSQPVFSNHSAISKKMNLLLKLISVNTQENFFDAVVEPVAIIGNSFLILDSLLVFVFSIRIDHLFIFLADPDNGNNE